MARTDRIARLEPCPKSNSGACLGFGTCMGSTCTGDSRGRWLVETSEQAFTQDDLDYAYRRGRADMLAETLITQAKERHDEG